jgi:hypothetical protein
MDDLDSLLEKGNTQPKKTILLLAAITALVLVGSGIYLLSPGSIDIRSVSTPAPLPPFSPDLSSTSSSTVQKIDLNTADREALLDLPGIGEVRANTLIEHRPYTSLDEVRTKTKLPFSVIDKLTNYVSF